MSDPLVTIGVPVYRGQEELPTLLDCIAGQTYGNLDVLISVDNDDRESEAACLPFVARDPRFRVHVQPTRLGWAGNTDWTMRHRRGAFYIYQQHDDLISPTYVADLVAAAGRWPDAVICFSKVRFTGQQQHETTAPSLLGSPIARALAYLRRLDWAPLRGLIRAAALERTSGLLLSDFDPFDSFGTEFRFMAELALLGEFRLVDGPLYFKSWHGANLSAKRAAWSRSHEIAAYACLAAWMVEVIAPAGATQQDRRDIFGIVVDRFSGRQNILEWVATTYAWQRREAVAVERAAGVIAERLKLSGIVRPPAISLPRGEFTPEERPEFLRQMFDWLKRGNRFDPVRSLGLSWEALAAGNPG